MSGLNNDGIRANRIPFQRAGSSSFKGSKKSLLASLATLSKKVSEVAKGIFHRGFTVSSSPEIKEFQKDGASGSEKEYRVAFDKMWRGFREQ